MSILNVDKIQPIGGGSTITVDATDIQASTGTITANSYTGVDNTLKVSIGGTEYVRTHSTGQVSIGSTFMWRSDTVAQVYGKSPDLSLSRFNDQFMIAGNETRVQLILVQVFNSLVMMVCNKEEWHIFGV